MYTPWSLILSLLSVPFAKAALPPPVSAPIARSYLAELTVEVESTSPAYNRSAFPHWATISGKCNTRETVLRRDGANVVTDGECRPTDGRWVSPYDDLITTNAATLDIDHIVPLKEAWSSGAYSWTTEQRKTFANDITRPQLAAVTAKLNRAKGDKDPAEWMPPLASFACTYVRAWVTVKHHYSLTIDSAEKAALANYLADC